MFIIILCKLVDLIEVFQIKAITLNATLTPLGINLTRLTEKCSNQLSTRQ